VIMRPIMQLALVALTLLAALVGAKPVWLNATWNTSAQGEVVTAGDFVAFGTGQGFDAAAISVNATTGFTVWSVQLPFGQSSFSPLVFVCDATPQLLFMASSSNFDGAYSALNRSNGVTLWTLPVTVPFTSEANWICPPTSKDPLLIITDNVIYSVDTVRGKLLFEHYANSTSGVQVFVVNRCGMHETSTCFVYVDLNTVVHVVDVRTGNVLSRTQLPVSFWDQYIAGSSADVFFVVGEAGTTAMRWNGTRVWSSPSSYAGGDDNIWVSQGPQNMNLTAFSTKTGEQLWNWPSVSKKLNTTSNSISITFKGMELPLVSSYCYQGVNCSTAAFDPRTGAIKWIVYNQSLTTPRFACPSYALFANQTVATLVRIRDGETRYVQTQYVAWAVAQTTSTILVQSSILASYPRF